MHSLLNANLKEKTVLVRADFNVPIINGKITNTFRIDSALETIKFCINNRAKVILTSHLGRPQKKDSSSSLYPIFEYLKSKLNTRVYFSDDCISKNSFDQSKKMKFGEVHLLENLRYYIEEEKCDLNFSKKLSSHADIFINDAFGTAHRKHSSNVGVTNFFSEKYFGFLFSKELDYLSLDFFNKQRNIVLILGGSKISDKIKIINRFNSTADKILIGGAMANNFLLAKKINIGKSLIEPKASEIAKKIILNNNKIVLPSDVLCTNKILDSNTKTTEINHIKDNDITVDIGPKTLFEYDKIIKQASCVVWNGPMGIIEHKEFSKGTIQIMNILKKYTGEGLISILGGGDTSSILKRNEIKEFTHVSTGGGACLSLLSGEILPAIKSMENK
ncbi:phosphoglycerate kinase [Candidatus Marinimicrobia bacterium]|nr:phosphoglycerate kinase [Candidatus Neomarinimicrobiota bacterium]